tara:strand:+ start:17401 stop:18237 length:837 start_codon:yes stop_codon:yes gene_type:complete
MASIPSINIKTAITPQDIHRDEGTVTIGGKDVDIMQGTTDLGEVIESYYNQDHSDGNNTKTTLKNIEERLIDDGLLGPASDLLGLLDSKPNAKQNAINSMMDKFIEGGHTAAEAGNRQEALRTYETGLAYTMKLEGNERHNAEKMLMKAAKKDGINLKHISDLKGEILRGELGPAYNKLMEGDLPKEDARLFAKMALKGGLTEKGVAVAVKYDLFYPLMKDGDLGPARTIIESGHGTKRQANVLLAQAKEDGILNLILTDGFIAEATKLGVNLKQYTT